MFVFFTFSFLLLSSNLFAMEMSVDTPYANRHFKMHKGTVKALHSNDAKRVHNVLEQEIQALDAVFYQQYAKAHNKHATLLTSISFKNINVRAQEIAQADTDFLNEENTLRVQHIVRLQKYSARELQVYKKVVTALVPQQEATTFSANLDNKALTVPFTGIAGLLSQYTSDPIAKVVCTALALAGGYVSIKSAPYTEVDSLAKDHAEWYQKKEAVLTTLNAFEQKVYDDIALWQRGLSRTPALAQIYFSQ